MSVSWLRSLKFSRLTGHPSCNWLSLLILLSLGFAGCARFAGSSQQGRDLLFEDDFEDGLATGWLLEGDDQGQAEIVDGALLLTIKAPGTVQYVALEDQVFSDMIMDVEATQIGGAPGSSYGLLLRMVAPDQFYRFEVTSNGEYTIERHDGAGAWERLTDGWQTSPAILQGINQTNRLRVAVAGGTFSFYANETLLTQVVDRNYTAGAVALDAGTFNQSDLQVAFDNVAIQAP